MSLYYVFVPLEGLHLTCDFKVYSAALYGTPPNYTPTRVGLHQVYNEPYELYGRIPVRGYSQLTEVIPIDELTLSALEMIPDVKLHDFTCLIFEVELDRPDYARSTIPEENTAILYYLLNRGEQIVDLLRLYFFRPGEDISIGGVGALGNGFYGMWIGNDGEDANFIARKVSRYQLVQVPLEVGIVEVRKIYNDDTYRELSSAACSDIVDLDPTLQKVFESLRAFRESRELQSWEARFRHLATIAESLAKPTEGDRLQGEKLRKQIAEIASAEWEWWLDDSVEEIVDDLWRNTRNPITHSLRTAMSLGRDPQSDMYKMEKIVISMLRALVSAWRLQHLIGEDPYE